MMEFKNLWKWLTFFFCSIALMLSAHPFYVSITAVDYNSKKQQVEVSCRIFYDDFELAIKSQLKQKIDVIHPKIKAQADSAIAQYIQSHFRLKIDGANKLLQFVGYEIVDDVAWCYFKTSQNSAPHKIEIYNNLLYEDFKTQTNIMHVTVNKERKSSKLDNPKRNVLFSFQPN